MIESENISSSFFVVLHICNGIGILYTLLFSRLSVIQTVIYIHSYIHSFIQKRYIIIPTRVLSKYIHFFFIIYIVHFQLLSACVMIMTRKSIISRAEEGHFCSLYYETLESIRYIC